MNRILIAFVGLFIVSLPMSCQQKDVQKIRRPAVAGMFYPGDANSLKQMIQQYLDRAKTAEVQGDIVGIWVPHAGYVYSGQVAANAYQTVRDRQYDAIIVVAPSHHVYLNGASIGDWNAYETPLGLVKIDQRLAQSIRNASSFIQCRDEVHQQEHAVEVQLPFIQMLFPGVPVVPMVAGQLNIEQSQSIAQAIALASAGKHVLLIASSDMSHYPDYDQACRVDHEMLSAVETMNIDKILQKDNQLMMERIPELACTLCGIDALAIVISACKILGADGVRILPYMNSGDITGDHSRVVGYGAAVFTTKESKSNMREGGVKLEEIPFNPEEKKELFKIARQSIQAALKRKELPVFQVESEHLKEKRGAFVTLTNRGQLRGCVGRFDASLPLYKVVSQMAEAAAIHDTRFMFDPVTLHELDDLDIKISILSPLKKIESIDDIEIGKHGIWIKQGNHSGTYLPEVATELGWNKEEFLSHCCMEKAHLHPDAWKAGAEIYIYSSQVLDEKDI